MKSAITFSLFFLLVICSATAQQQVFALDSFIRLVKANHPVAKQSELMVEKAEHHCERRKVNLILHFR